MPSQSLETSMGRSRNAQENKDSEYVKAVIRFVHDSNHYGVKLIN